MKRPIRLGISTCPNDTFAFHGLLTKAVDWRGLEFEVDLLDIEQLNERLLGPASSAFDVGKVSFHAALGAAERIVVLPTGSALGFGVGPLLLAATPESTPCDTTQLTLCPGKHTTASLLFALFHPGSTRVEQAVFSEIMPRLRAGSADFGVCIHEGRFTWQQQGLTLVEDLGFRWEAETGTPLPLGGIVASRSLPADTIARVQRVIADSLRFAFANPAAPLPTMRDHAQELDDPVLMQHVDLYINDQTLELGPLGQRALDELCVRAAAVGLGSGGRLEIFPG